MDEPGEHYSKSNKPNRGRQIPLGNTYMWTTKGLYSETEGKMVVPGADRWGKCRNASQKYKLYYKINKFWRYNAQHSDYS